MTRRLAVTAAVLALVLPLAAAPLAAADEKAAPEDKPAAKKEGFKPLLGGKNLDGWTTTGNWFVEDGILRLEPRPGEKGWQRYDAYLWADKQYGDFVLDLEFKIAKGGNSGVFIRVKDKKNPVATGMEVQILDTHGKKNPGPHDCGGVIGTVGPSKNMAKPAGEWNRYIITCKGSNLKVRLNGEQIIDCDLSKTSRKDRPMKGWLGFQDEAKPLWYRNIYIKTLD
ncbi:MAG: DUF1080 domain-containing protein [Phycisphaerae bacterium]